MHRNAFATLVTGLAVLGFAAFGILAADAANPSFTARVNSLSQLPASGFLQATQCPSAAYCVAVGSDGNGQPLVLAGNPSTWGQSQAHEIPLGDAFAGGELLSIACTSSTSCVAVGLGYDPNYNEIPLVLAGNPSTWGAAEAREIALGSTFGSGGSLESVACTSSTSCVAVGIDGHSMPLVLAGNPSTWEAAQAHQIALGSTFGGGGGLGSITCTSPTSCVAVGGDRHDMPLVLAGNPATWAAAQAREITLGSAFGSVGGSNYASNYLSSVDCSSSTACVAVGEDANYEPLVLAGDPSTWGAAQAQEVTLGSAFGPLDPSSSDSLSSVSCTSSTACVAVGEDANFEPLVLAGDPSTWGTAQAQEITPGSGGSGFLGSIACTSSMACVAVGDDSATENPLVLAGNPSTWGPGQTRTIVLKGAAAFGPPGLPPSLACPSATSCFELATYYPSVERTYLLRGGATAWDTAGATVLTNAPNQYNAMTCTSSTYCVAVGYGPVVLAGNPSTWGTAHARTIQLGTAFGPDGGTLESVACTSPTYCVAVGEDFKGNGQPLVLAGNPSTWTAANAKQLTMSAARYSAGELESVACTSATHCIAVGHDGHSYGGVYAGPQEPLVLTGNPATWGVGQTRQITLGTTFASYGKLSSIACSSSTYCVSVGESGFHAKPLVLTGNPSTWTAASAFNLGVPSATPTTVEGYSFSASKDTGYLTSISCKSATYCVVVGGDNIGAPLYTRGDPAQWKGKMLARPAQNGGSFMRATVTATSCTPFACFVGGWSSGGDFVATIK